MRVVKRAGVLPRDDWVFSAYSGVDLNCGVDHCNVRYPLRPPMCRHLPLPIHARALLGLVGCDFDFSRDQEVSVSSLRTERYRS